jgi:hypothetical protein
MRANAVTSPQSCAVSRSSTPPNLGFSLSEIKDLLGSRNGPAHERLPRLALHKIPEIDELIDRATTVKALLSFCGDCQCHSIDECRLLEEPTTLLDHRALRPLSALRTGTASQPKD